MKIQFRNKSIRKIIALCVVCITFYFIGKTLYKNWHTIEFSKLKFNFVYLGVSYFIVALSFLLGAYIWKRNLSMLKEHISFIAALRVNALSTLPKYAPGKVWGIIGKVYLAKKEGISEHSSVVTISLETILSILGGIILFLFTASSIFKGRLPYTFYILLIPICAIITHPRILIGVTNLFLKLFKRPLIDFMPKYIRILELLILYTISWVLQGTSIFFLIKSFYAISENTLLKIIGFHSFSWVIGFITIITPGGLGVKEGVFSYFLSFIVPSGIAVIISLVVRIWGTIAEIIFSLIFLGSIRKYF